MKKSNDVEFHRWVKPYALHPSSWLSGTFAFAMSCGLELNEIDCVVSQLSLAIYGERADLCILVFLWVMPATP